MPGVIITFLLAAAAASAAQTAPPAGAATIVTTGQAVVRRAADRALISLSVETRARTSRDAQRQNADAAAAVEKRLAELRIPHDAQRTLGLSLQEEFDTANGKRTARGFVARNTLEIRVDDVARAGEIADAAVEAGATAINGIAFDLKDRSAAEHEALRAAVVDARARADAAAAGAGVAIDRVLKIEDERTSGMPPRPMVAFASRAEAGATTDVEPGFIEVRASVVLTVTLK